ncbi:hypothetical protein CAF53_02510 [Sphingobium sp. LB126]|uniref:hypothetical protein n=1 Tax=Sphingobium sp. LB126 TaxID=1983755 RepID=UPI000C20179B|nr:hypothetical protein [Sphingobium sp. LB126]PJG47236.1 hypothetical protein CAF53_02510 [Sphingobium sp. LB126]
MTSITDNCWTLHYTIGSIVVAKVKSGDTIHMPGGCGDLIVVGGRAPKRKGDCGGVTVRNPATDSTDSFEVRPAAIGTVWISAAGGWAELPPSQETRTTRYNAEAVQQQIERDRRRHRIGMKEERLIHALLKGRGN